jgi:hypothetical protein
MKKLTESDLEDMFDNYLDDLVNPIKIGRYEYSASMALYKIDKIAYNEELSNYIDYLLSEGEIKEQDGEYYENE